MSIENIDNEMYIVTDYSDFLNEGAGSLEPFPNHIKKTITKGGGGENSEVDHLGRASSYSNLKGHINNAMKSGKVLVVHHNGKPIASTHTTSDHYGGRAKYGVQDHENTLTATRSVQRHGTGKWDNRTKKYIPSEYSSHQDTHHSKDEAIHKVLRVVQKHTGEHDIEHKDTYKHHNIELKTVAADQDRVNTSARRRANKPAMQDNHVKNGEDRWGYKNVRKTSSTPAGSFDKIKKHALNKMVDKHVDDKDNPHEQAHQIHQKLSDALHAGDSKAVLKHTNDLADHVRNKGIDHDSFDKSRYKSALSDLRNKNYGTDYARKTIKDLKDKGVVKEMEENNMTLSEAINEHGPEILDELSKETLWKYNTKAQGSVDATKKRGPVSKTTQSFRAKRNKGITLSGEKLTKKSNDEYAKREVQHAKERGELHAHFHEHAPKILADNGYTHHSSIGNNHVYIKSHEPSGHASMVNLKQDPNHGRSSAHVVADHTLTDTMGTRYHQSHEHWGYSARNDTLDDKKKKHLDALKSDIHDHERRLGERALYESEVEERTEMLSEGVTNLTEAVLNKDALVTESLFNDLILEKIANILENDSDEPDLENMTVAQFVEEYGEDALAELVAENS